MNDGQSCQPCGCDPGIPYKAPDCTIHKIDIQLEHREELTGYQRDKTIGRVVLKDVKDSAGLLTPQQQTEINAKLDVMVAPDGGHPRFFELLDEMAVMHRSKGHDYSKTNDPLSNLKRSAVFGVEPWRGTLIRMGDKWSRIEELTNGKTAKHESLRDSLFDLAAYALLCLILLEEKGGLVADSLDQSSFMMTYTGKKFTPFDPQVDQIDILDISQALSMLCRFTGHLREFYSVAQHSVLVSQYLPPHLQFEGLMHDAQEAYINDLSRPIKHHPGMQAYRDLERGLERVIRQRFELPEQLSPAVKVVDNKIVIDEAWALFSPVPAWAKEHPRLGLKITPWSPEQAKREFMDQFWFVSTSYARPRA